MQVIANVYYKETKSCLLAIPLPAYRVQVDKVPLPILGVM